MTEMFVPAQDVVVALDPDGLVLLQPTRGSLFRLNRVGAHIWQHLGRRAGVHQVAAQISARCGAVETAAHAHAQQFLSDLERHGLVTRSRES